MSTWPDRIGAKWGAQPRPALLLAAAIALLGGAAGAFAVSAGHTSGFARYARVDRPDGAYREMLVDDGTLAALRAGRGIPEAASA